MSPGNESSENYKRDYETKPKQYAAIGVSEYWIIDPDRQWVRIGTLNNDNYQFEIFRGEETIASPTFPDLTLTPSQILNTAQSP